MFRLRMIGKIIRSAGLGHISLAFLLIFLVCAALIWVLDPSIETGEDALWFCFQAATTIGFGDAVATSLAGRIVLVCLSIVSVFYLAVVTGVVVAYCNELVRAQSNRSSVQFLDQLEHLEELNPEELAALSARARAFRKGHSGRNRANP